MKVQALFIEKKNKKKNTSSATFSIHFSSEAAWNS